MGLGLVGFVGGAIGTSFFGEEGDEGLLPSPEVHLPAQRISGDEAGDALKGGTDFILTNTILSSFVTTGVLILLFVLGTARLKLVPGRFQGFLEASIEGLLGFVESVVGPERARTIFPLIATIFFFVVVNAWLSLLPVYQSLGVTHYDTVTLSQLEKADFVPGERVTIEALEEEHLVEHGRKVQISGQGVLSTALEVEAHRFSEGAATAIEAAGGESIEKSTGLSAALLRPAGTDVNMPLALALVSFVFVEALGIRAFGFHYFGKFIRFGNLLRGRIFMGLIDVFVGILELLSELIRVISFTFRLFGNMLAGEILLLVSAFLVSFVFIVPFYGLELLVGFIQALIFAGLTLVFASVALTPPEHGEE